MILFSMTYLCRGMELKMKHLLVAKKMSTKCITTLIPMKIWKHPNDSTVILYLFDASAVNEIYDPAKRDSRYFPNAPIHYLDASKHLPFLAYIYKALVICYKVPSKPKQPCTTTYSWYHPIIKKGVWFMTNGLPLWKENSLKSKAKTSIECTIWRWNHSNVWLQEEQKSPWFSHE